MIHDPIAPPGQPTTPRPALQPIAWWKVTLGFVLGILITAAAATAVWSITTPGLSGKDLASARLDVVKVGLSVGVGLGGAFGLYLALRRQRATEADLDNRERALVLQRQVASSNEGDAAARRVTDLYTKAAEQLGSDKAPVRLAGLYAFERLAQDNPDQLHLRQTVVNVICAYLRMPYTLPADEPPGSADDHEGNSVDSPLKEHRERQQEREVRLAAQRILRRHLRRGENPEASETFWDDIDLDLTSSTLIDFDLHKCRLRHARFDGANFIGITWFGDTTFTGQARFGHATFTDRVGFGRTVFGQNTWFNNVKFADALFDNTTFSSQAIFTDAVFGKDADFSAATFGGPARFTESTFSGRSRFMGATFASSVKFVDVTFAGRADFQKVTFSEENKPNFGMATFEGEDPPELQQFRQAKAASSKQADAQGSQGSA